MNGDPIGGIELGPINIPSMPEDESMVGGVSSMGEIGASPDAENVKSGAAITITEKVDDKNTLKKMEDKAEELLKLSPEDFAKAEKSVEISERGPTKAFTYENDSGQKRIEFRTKVTWEVSVGEKTFSVEDTIISRPPDAKKDSGKPFRMAAVATFAYIDEVKDAMGDKDKYASLSKNGYIEVQAKIGLFSRTVSRLTGNIKTTVTHPDDEPETEKTSEPTKMIIKRNKITAAVAERKLLKKPKKKGVGEIRIPVSSKPLKNAAARDSTVIYNPNENPNIAEIRTGGQSFMVKIDSDIVDVKQFENQLQAIAQHAEELAHSTPSGEAFHLEANPSEQGTHLNWSSGRDITVVKRELEATGVDKKAKLKGKLSPKAKKAQATLLREQKAATAISTIFTNIFTLAAAVPASTPAPPHSNTWSRSPRP